MLRTRLSVLPKHISLHNVAPAFDPVQEESLKENCLLVDKNDKVIGHASKRDCHKVKQDGSLLLHRAFSVFLFNSKRELLLQKRSDTKITFPSCFTNTCCSHPLFDIEEERNETDALGVKLAAIRRLNHELGVPKEEIDLQDFKYITRFIYKSLGDGVWGEYEMDYVLFVLKDVTIKPNPEEVSEVCFVSQKNFRDFLGGLKDPLTPWFRLLSENQLNMWWENINRLEDFIDHKKINQFL